MMEYGIKTLIKTSCNPKVISIVNPFNVLQKLFFPFWRKGDWDGEFFVNNENVYGK